MHAYIHIYIHNQSMYGGIVSLLPFVFRDIYSVTFIRSEQQCLYAGILLLF